jgi:uncharacterized membrane protein
MKATTYVSALVLLALSAPQGARAGLQVCNDTDANQSVAVGYEAEGGLMSRGWWNLAPTQCAETVPGDLSHRYYYLFSAADGWDFSAEDFRFCTMEKAFVIPGNEECAARGFQSAMFRQIDTGASAGSHRVALSEVTRQVDSRPEAAGEGYHGDARVQGCAADAEDTQQICSFHAGGTKFFVVAGAGTPAYLFQRLHDLEPGAAVTVRGRLTEVSGLGAHVVLSKLSPRELTEADHILNRMQGTWLAHDDANARFTIAGSERISTFGGRPGHTEYLTIGQTCGSNANAGLYLSATDAETGEEQCYKVEALDAEKMTLIYLPDGNFLEFRRGE